MVNNIEHFVELVIKRTDLITKLIVILFIGSIFANYLYDNYYVNILGIQFLFPQIVQTLLQRIEFLLYWIIPFVYFIPIGLFLLLMIGFIIEEILKYIERKYAISCVSKKDWWQFLSNQSLNLIFSITLVSFYIGGLYYIIATFNHIGSLISIENYTSSFNNLNPIKDLIPFSSYLINVTHKEWIELSFDINSTIVLGLCIYWCYINPYLTVQEEWISFKAKIKKGVNED